MERHESITCFVHENAGVGERQECTVWGYVIDGEMGDNALSSSQKVEDERTDSRHTIPKWSANTFRSGFRSEFTQTRRWDMKGVTLRWALWLDLSSDGRNGESNEWGNL
jgi:hypothetical protein